MFVFRAGGVFALILTLAWSAQAAILFDNINLPIQGTDAIAGDGPQQYDSFTTDGTGRVNTIQLLLDTTGDSGGFTDLAIYDDLGNNPNSLVHTVGFPDDTQLTGTPSIVSFSLNEQLTPDTRYWVVLTDDNFGAANASFQEWAYAADASGTGVAGEFNGNTATAPALLNGDGSTLPNGTPTAQPYMMCVSNNSSDAVCAIPPPPVPEPATLGILGAGLAALGLFRRRRPA